MKNIKSKHFFLPIGAVGIIMYLYLIFIDFNSVSIIGTYIFKILANFFIIAGIGGFLIDFILNIFKNKFKKVTKKTNNDLIINGWVFYVIFLVYLILSFILFLYSSGGWYTLFIFWTTGYLFIFLFLLVSILFFFKEKKQIFINKRMLIILFVLLFLVQLFSIFFNYSDCGDFSGGSYFISHILFSYHGCFVYAVDDRSAVNIFNLIGKNCETIALFIYFFLVYQFSFIFLKSDR